jgi:hypothetical protein
VSYCSPEQEGWAERSESHRLGGLFRKRKLCRRPCDSRESISFAALCPSYLALQFNYRKADGFNRGTFVMTVYFQHIGEQLWQRDGKRSVGTSAGGVLTFKMDDIAPYVTDISPDELAIAENAVLKHSQGKFQIWGLPSGATNAIEKMSTGDILLLLESDSFRYIGRVVFKFSQQLRSLSNHLWGEGRFPLIVLMSGTMCQYVWSDFLDHFSYDPNYSWQKLRGRTNSVAAKKILESKFKSDEVFYQYISSTYFEPKHKP